MRASHKIVKNDCVKEWGNAVFDSRSLEFPLKKIGLSNHTISKKESFHVDLGFILGCFAVSELSNHPCNGHELGYSKFRYTSVQ